MPQAFASLIFDVDGTLADTEDGHRRAYNRTFEEAGLPWHWDEALYAKLLAVAGGKERMRHFVDDFLPPAQRPVELELLIRRLYEHKTRLYAGLVRGGGMPFRPGIRALIDAAHATGLLLAVATTTAQDNVEALLEANIGPAWRGMFKVLGCGDVVPKKKPAPDVYLWVLAQLGLKADQCLALEDSEVGLRASLAAGLRTVVTLNIHTRGQCFDGALAVFEDASDLAALCRASGLALPLDTGPWAMRP